MNQKPSLSSSGDSTVPDDVFNEAADSVSPSTPWLIIEAIATQLHQARESRIRIIKEGSVVRDMKGAVIPHPALKIESDAIKIYSALLAKHGKEI